MSEHKPLPLFVALDLNTLREARQTMDMLSGLIDAVKIGPRLYARAEAIFSGKSLITATSFFLT